MKRICDGVKHLHEMKVIHRDLKVTARLLCQNSADCWCDYLSLLWTQPENILLASPDGDTDCKVGDFGLSKLFPENQKNLTTQTLCGTPGYVAPEVLNRKQYDEKIDVWSLGVIAYIVLCGFPPFPLDMAANSVAKVKSASFSYPMPHWDGISEDAKDFINKMIVVDVGKRMCMEDVLAHPWLAGVQ